MSSLVSKAKRMFTDIFKGKEMSYLEKSVIFYKSFHNNHINQWIHLICIPLIAFTGFIFFAYTPYISMKYKTLSSILTMLLPSGSKAYHSSIFDMKLTYGNVVITIYVIYYILLEFLGLAGILAAALFIVGSNYAKTLVLYDANVWKPALIVHLLAWITQFYGHAVHEKRSPALLDNLVQAFLSAPFFVLLESMFALGYRKDLQERVDRQVSKNLKEFKAKQSNNKSK